MDLLGTLVSAWLIGVASGVSPGPMLIVVVSSSLQHGLLAGMRMAVAPLLSDLPILVIVFGLFAGVDVNSHWLGLLALLGAVYLSWLALKELKRQHFRIDGDGPSAISLPQAVAINFMNPHPWMFWFGVGGPIVLAESSNWAGRGALFVGGFYLGLVGVKVCLAWLVASTRHGLSEYVYRIILRAAGFALLLFALILFWQGYRLLTGS